MSLPPLDLAATRDPEERERGLFRELARFIAHAKESSEAYARRFAGIGSGDVADRKTLGELPPTRKHELVYEQEERPPFGGHDAFGHGDPIRLFMSPGPIAECEFAGSDYWRTAEILHAAGVESGMTVHNSFSYHFTPAGVMCEAGAHRLGCRVFPAGTGNTEQQARAIERLRCDAYTGTPDFIGTILRKAAEIGADISSLKIASVTGGYLSPDLRSECRGRGVHTLQWYGTADVGGIAYETEADEPMTVVEGLLVEIVDPLTARPVEDGEKGEVLVTNFNRAYPLIRYALGDLSKVVKGPGPDGRTNMRIAGWLGRCSEAVKVKGMFIHPAQIARLVGRIDDLEAAQAFVARDESGGDRLALKCVAAAGTGAEAALAERIGDAFRAETGLRADIEFVAGLDGQSLLTDTRSVG